MKTMLDKCAVAGDVTQAIDRRGAWSCAVIVIGGTENTAVKLQSADSADGEFTDFKTLISADEAEADQYKGFVIDLSGAGNFIKIVGATMATCVLGDCDHDVKTVAIKAGEIPSGADLEDNKTATIDVSTYTEPVEIEPTEGKDGMKKATIKLSNIPSGGSVLPCYKKTIGTPSSYYPEYIYAAEVYDDGGLDGEPYYVFPPLTEYNFSDTENYSASNDEISSIDQNFTYTRYKAGDIILPTVN